MDPDADKDAADLAYVVATAERIRLDVAMLCELVDRGIEIDGQAVEIGGSRWIIYGRSSYDGEMILAEYGDADEAAAVLRAMPSLRPRI